MEYILGTIAKQIQILKKNIDTLNYSEWPIIMYQRSTVLIGDFILFYALLKLTKSLSISRVKFTLLLATMQSFAGLVLVDNMHFQYNTVLFGIFFYGIALIANEQFLMGAIVYSTCLCMKQIYLYTAPGFVIFYLKFYIFRKGNSFSQFLTNTIKLGICILSVLLISFSPFIFLCIKNHSAEPIIQIMRRLFQFKRGLMHSYWAANFWAIYSFLDKVLFFLKGSNGMKKNTTALGVTQETEFDVLPNITPMISNGIVIATTLIYITKSLMLTKSDVKKPLEHKKVQTNSLIKYCIISNLIFYNFGFQVHEKAFMIVSLLTLIYYFIEDNNEKYITSGKGEGDYLLTLSNLIVLVGGITQMPLIHNFKDYLPKISIFFTYYCFVTFFFFKKSRPNILLVIFVIMCLALDFNTVFQNQFNYDLCDCKLLKLLQKINQRFPFASLMLFSVINSIMTQIIFVVLFLF